jgi:hypothetical protein
LDFALGPFGFFFVFLTFFSVHAQYKKNSVSGPRDGGKRGPKKSTPQKTDEKQKKSEARSKQKERSKKHKKEKVTTCFFCEG